MIRRTLAGPLLLLFLVLAVLAMPAGTGMSSAEADEADTCGLEQVRGVKVTASVDFDHRGLDYSKVTSVMDIEIPASWKHAADLLLDPRAAEYRQALRCLLGKGLEDNPLDFDERRSKPLTVDSDGKKVAVHYEAVVTVLWLGAFQVGPWSLEAGPDVWTVRLKPPKRLSQVPWANVEVQTGGPRAWSVSPESAIGKDGTVLKWQNKKPNEFTVSFRPPAAQQWDAKTVSPKHPWEAVGLDSGSSAAVHVLRGVLLLIAARKLRQGLARPPADDEKKALGVLRSWALLSTGLGLLVYMGDNVLDLVRSTFFPSHPTDAVFSLFSLLFLGAALCVFGKLPKPLLVIPCSVVVVVAGLLAGSWLAPLAVVAAVCLFCTGAVFSVRRVLRMIGGSLPSWLVVSLPIALSVVTVLWTYLVFRGFWDRISWLADTHWPTYEGRLLWHFDTWWWDFPRRVLPDLWDTASLALLALVPLGVLHVCRAERKDGSSFTPTASEQFFLMVVFTLVVPSAGGIYFGISGYFVSVLLGLLSAWALLSWGRRRAVLARPAIGNRLLGQVVPMADRSELLRMVRRYRDLQDSLHRSGSGKPVETTADREAIERDIDQMDRFLPEGVRLIDVAFACGPMTTWWENARKCAIIACFVGIPGTGLMLWHDMVGGHAWEVTIEYTEGFVRIIRDILGWQLTWVGAAFFMGALWRSLPGRYGPTKAFYVAIVFSVPVCTHRLLGELSGHAVQETIAIISAFAAVMTFTGLVMDAQTFTSERRYWPSRAGLIMYVYQMRFASVGFLVGQLVTLATTIWATFRHGDAGGRSSSP
ncbi:DUF6185 family protein [Streptomyces sp. SudanB182_2057]|uniref:DUF6185 family protein n=1 Tax=Streptomyces sp. SudanB182_2057 TaxID=3035281 RepID=UPI003F5601F6